MSDLLRGSSTQHHSKGADRHERSNLRRPRPGCRIHRRKPTQHTTRLQTKALTTARRQLHVGNFRSINWNLAGLRVSRTRRFREAHPQSPPQTYKNAKHRQRAAQTKADAMHNAIASTGFNDRKEPTQSGHLQEYQLQFSRPRRHTDSAL